MNQQASLLDDPIHDLADRSSWRTFVHPVTGKEHENAIESLCGRYSILKTRDSRGHDLFIAWRRRISPEGRWEPPDLIAGCMTGDAASEACATHAEANP